MNDLSGQILGQYELLNLIGRGGMATVYRARQRSMGREVAVKVISPDLADEAEFSARFEREARIIAGLHHPYILDVHDFGREGSLIYLVMRLMTGGSLKDELRGGRLSMRRVLQVVQQIASALDYAHANSIVHRDLKPSNVLLDNEGHVALTDFGIAKMMGGNLVDGLTQAGIVMGTPKYMSPEQWRNEPVDGRADVYALGVITYQMLTGQVPFNADTPHSLMYMHLDGEVPSLRNVRPDLPPEVDRVIRRALAKRPDQRYSAAGVFARELAGVLGVSEEEATRLLTWEDDPSYPVRPPQEPPAYDLSTRRDPPRRPGFAPSRPIQPSRPPEPAPTMPSETPTPEPREAPQPLYTEPPPEPRPEPRPEPAPPPRQSYRYDQPAPPPRRRTPPIRQAPPPAAPPRRRNRPPSPEQAGVGRFFAVILTVIIALGIFIGVAFVIAVIASSGGSNNDTEPTVLPATDAPPTISPELRPRVTITTPVDNTTVPLGTVVRIEFTATHTQPITRIELRWFDQAIDSQAADGVLTYSGTFFYTVNTNETHVLEVVPFSGAIEGFPARVRITGQ